MINLMNSITTRRLTLTVLLLSLGSLTALAVSLRQDDDEKNRRIRRAWEKKFREDRDKAKKTSPTKSTPKPKAEKSEPVKSTPKPVETASTAQFDAATTPAPDVAIEGELIGLTIWRLRRATPEDGRDQLRLMVQKEGDKAGEKTGELLSWRVSAVTLFRKSDLARLGIEVPRADTNYLYVIDREVYADGSMSDPYIIFPARSTPAGDEKIRAGQIVYVPSRNDPIPYFRFRPSRNQVSERLTIIISPQRLDLPLADGDPLKLDSRWAAQIAQWEKQWDSAAEKLEAHDDVGKGWTVAEKEAGEGKRLLVQGDPLPQTIYRVRAKPGEPAIVVVPLRIVD